MSDEMRNDEMIAMHGILMWRADGNFWEVVSMYSSCFFSLGKHITAC